MFFWAQSDGLLGKGVQAESRHRTLRMLEISSADGGWPAAVKRKESWGGGGGNVARSNEGKAKATKSLPCSVMEFGFAPKGSGKPSKVLIGR